MTIEDVFNVIKSDLDDDKEGLDEEDWYDDDEENAGD
jgi:hypothetical protein